MDFLFHAAGALGALLLLAASFTYIIAPRQASELLKRLAIGVAGFISCTAIVGQFVHADPSWFFLVFVLSGAAYAIRKAGKPRVGQSVGAKGGSERTRLP
jgi:hypothetical protein